MLIFQQIVFGLFFYQRGDLETYIESEPEVDRSRKAGWILTLMETILHFYRSKVLVDDMALRNILVADDLSLKMIDFGQRPLMPLDANINIANDNGLTAEADIFHLGCLIYSIVIWERYECNLFECQWVRPLLRDLPNVDHLFCGEFIRICWSVEYSSMEQLYCDTHGSLEHVMHEV